MEPHKQIDCVLNGWLNFSLFQDIKYDQCFVATGGTPRTLPVAGNDLGNVFCLRVPEEATKVKLCFVLFFFVLFLCVLLIIVCRFSVQSTERTWLLLGRRLLGWRQVLSVLFIKKSLLYSCL
jgi:hypothetical protein